MKILTNNLRELAEHIETLATKTCQADAATADLLWSVGGRLRYRAQQVETEQSLNLLRKQLDEENIPLPISRKTELGSAIREKIGQTTRKDEDGPPSAPRRASKMSGEPQ